MLRLVLLNALALAMLAPAMRAQTGAPVARWYKGNLHTHTIYSDGDSPAGDVVAWYKRHGYQFLVITDHDAVTDPAPLDPNPHDNFLVIPGEEITNARLVHVNAIGIDRTIAPQSSGEIPAILQASLDAVRAQGGIPLINHPNFGWAFTAREMLGLRGAGLLEIASGHPIVNHEGGGGVPSTEAMWDDLLTAGMRVHAAAVDDAHHFRDEDVPHKAAPGRAWVTVRAPALTREAIVGALDRGEFYASTGVTLADVRATPESLAIEMAEDDSLPAALRVRYRTIFIGEGGRELSVSVENPATYRFTGRERYVRARVEDSGGRRAWIQPVMPRATPSPVPGGPANHRRPMPVETPRRQ